MGGSLELRVGLEGNGELMLMGTGVLLGDENVLILTVVIVVKLSEYTKTTLNVLIVWYVHYISIKLLSLCAVYVTQFS